MARRGQLLMMMFALVALVAEAREPESDSDARARAHFEIGRGLYKLGSYNDAIREFAAGYLLAPRPGFLLNLAQSHRRLNHISEAKTFCERFLAEAPADEPGREQATALLAEIEREEALTPKPPAEAPALPPTAPLPTAAPPTAPPPPSLVAPPASAVASAPRPRSRRWIWPVVAVGAAAVAATVAGVLVVVLSTDNAARARGSCTGGCVLLDGFR